MALREFAGTVLDTLGVNSAVFAGGLFGSIISLKFLAPESSWWMRIGMAVGGMAASVFLTPLAAELLSLKPTSSAAIAFILGLYGMSIVSEVNDWLRSGQVKALLSRWSSK